MIKTPLWPHQSAAKRFIAERGSSLLAMEMRTGKTLATLSAIEEEGLWPALIVCPKKVVSVWVDQIIEHTDWFSHTAIFDADMPGTLKAKVKALKGGCFDLVILNYDIVWREPLLSWILEQPWKVIILDESHRIKGHNSKVSKGMYKISKEKGNTKKICLTGTPFHNAPTDIFGQARFLDRSIFDSIPHPFNPGERVNGTIHWTAFRSYYEVLRALPSKRGVFMTMGYKNLEDLERRISPYMFIVRTEDIADLPPVQFINRFVKLGSTTTKMYRELKKEALIEMEEGAMSVSNVIVKTLRLQQLTGGHIKLDGENEYRQVDTAKIEALEAIAEELSGEPFVVFCRFRAEIAAIRKRLGQLGITTSELSGSHNTLKAWQEGETQAIIVQIQSGAEGISLRRASVVIMYSVDYSLGSWQQAIARVKDFDNPDKSIAVYNLIAKNTIDTAVYSALQNKANIADALIAALRNNNH
jgi:SNF2 family DNA or RNA helicase